jgi:hypothetical protein
VDSDGTGDECVQIVDRDVEDRATASLAAVNDEQ